MQEKEILRLFKTAYAAFEDFDEGAHFGIGSQTLGDFMLAISGLISSLTEDKIENTILHAAALYFLIFVYSGLDEKNYLKITDRADSEVREEFSEYEHFRSEAEKVLKGIIPPGEDAAAIVNKYSAENEIRFREAFYSGSQLLGYYSKLDYKGNMRKKFMPINPQEAEKSLKNLMRISLYKNHTIYDVLKKYPELISDIFREYFPDYDDYDEEEESDYTEEPPADNEEEYIQQNFFND